MNKNIYIPSFKLERKTKALNKSLWGFVGLISIFTIEFLVFVTHLITCYVLEIESTLTQDHLAIISTGAILIFAIIFGVGLYQFLNALLHAYKIEDNKIIKGRIIHANKIKDSDMVVNAALTTFMAKNINDSNQVVAANAAKNMYNIIDLIKLNLNKEYVDNFFDTNIYKKKTYNNPIFIKETKYSLIYSSDEKQKIVIPKLYEGMQVTLSPNKEHSLIYRIIVRSLIILLIFLSFSIIDLSIGIHQNADYQSNIKHTCTKLQSDLNIYGYVLSDDCNFKKEQNNITSYINYEIDKEGEITDIDIELYYDKNNYDSNELTYILNSLDSNFSTSELNQFIDEVSTCVNGTCTYQKITNETTTLRIGSSNGFINIHNH